MLGSSALFSRIGYLWACSLTLLPVFFTSSLFSGTRDGLFTGTSGLLLCRLIAKAFGEASSKGTSYPPTLGRVMKRPGASTSGASVRPRSLGTKWARELRLVGVFDGSKH